MRIFESVRNGGFSGLLFVVYEYLLCSRSVCVCGVWCVCDCVTVPRYPDTQIDLSFEKWCLLLLRVACRARTWSADNNMYLVVPTILSTFVNTRYRSLTITNNRPFHFEKSPPRYFRLEVRLTIFCFFAVSFLILTPGFPFFFFFSRSLFSLSRSPKYMPSVRPPNVPGKEW